MAASLIIGQRLKTTTGEFVTLTKIEDEYIYVFYKGKTYKREKSIIGKKLFINQNKMKSLGYKVAITPSEDTKVTKAKSCLNCMEMRKGDCFGKQSTCEFFRSAPTISKETWDSWSSKL